MNNQFTTSAIYELTNTMDCIHSNAYFSGSKKSSRTYSLAFDIPIEDEKFRDDKKFQCLGFPQRKRLNSHDSNDDCIVPTMYATPYQPKEIGNNFASTGLLKQVVHKI